LESLQQLINDLVLEERIDNKKIRQIVLSLYFDTDEENKLK